MGKTEETGYKKAVLELAGQIKDDDIAFLRQVYTIIKRHIKK